MHHLNRHTHKLGIGLGGITPVGGVFGSGR